MSKISENVVSGSVLPPQRGNVPNPPTPTSAQAFTALGLITTEVVGYLKVRDQERTRRGQITAYRDLEIEKIRVAERMLTGYFERAFAERAQTIDSMFESLDAAIASGDDNVVRSTLAGIVDIAKSSPLAAVGDLSQIRAALDDPKHTWQF